MKDTFYPPTINRAVVMVVPQKPFYDWDKAVFPDLPTMADEEKECTSYLLKDPIHLFEPKEALKNDWKWIFENELFSICTDENEWPQKRTWKVFTEWFEIKFSTVVFDLVNQPILKED